MKEVIFNAIGSDWTHLDEIVKAVNEVSPNTKKGSVKACIKTMQKAGAKIQYNGLNNENARYKKL